MKRIVVPGLVVSAVGFFLGWLLHGMLLKQQYMRISQIFRPEQEMMGNMPVFIVGFLIWGFALSWLYSKGVEEKDWVGQGLRFGLGIVGLVVIPMYIGSYVMQPWPASVAFMAGAADAVINIVAALILAAMHRGRAGAVRATAAIA